MPTTKPTLCFHLILSISSEFKPTTKPSGTTIFKVSSSSSSSSCSEIIIYIYYKSYTKGSEEVSDPPPSQSDF